jgi:hypothetical protein
MNTSTNGASLQDDGSLVGWIVGGGILFVQACAVIPGLLPCLLLLLPFVLPLVVLGALVGLLVGVPLALFRLVARLVRPRGERLVARDATAAV